MNKWRLLLVFSLILWIKLEKSNCKLTRELVLNNIVSWKEITKNKHKYPKIKKYLHYLALKTLNVFRILYKRGFLKDMTQFILKKHSKYAFNLQIHSYSLMNLRKKPSVAKITLKWRNTE